MRNSRALRAVAVVLATAWLLAAAAGAEAQSGPVKIEWLSWSHFRFTSPGGKVVLTNPFVTNPDSPIKAADIAKADFILVADGHRDEVGSTDEIAIKTGAKVLAAGEMMRNYFADRKLPEDQFLSTGPGDWHRLGGITIRFENGLTVYFAGSTALTLDMQLWGSLYRPDVAILPLAGRRDVQDMVHMVRLLRTENPNLKTVIPHHHRLQPPPGAPTPAELDSAIKAAGLPVQVLNPELSRAYDLVK